MKQLMFILLIASGLSVFDAPFQSNKNGVVNLNLSPVSLFHSNCARCHGEEGVSYGKDFAHITDDSLRNAVNDMMFGPAGVNPDSIEIEAMIAYARSLKDKKPFADFMNLKSFLNRKEDILRVDASPRSVLITGNKKVKIKKGANNWELIFNLSKIKKVIFTVTRDGKSAYLRYPDELWSE
jgi:cytochrome c553